MVRISIVPGTMARDVGRRGLAGAQQHHPVDGSIEMRGPGHRHIHPASACCCSWQQAAMALAMARRTLITGMESSSAIWA